MDTPVPVPVPALAQMIVIILRQLETWSDLVICQVGLLTLLPRHSPVSDSAVPVLLEGDLVLGLQALGMI